jgi:hypothetical protein
MSKPSNGGSPHATLCDSLVIWLQVHQKCALAILLTLSAVLPGVKGSSWSPEPTDDCERRTSRTSVSPPAKSSERAPNLTFTLLLTPENHLGLMGG